MAFKVKYRTRQRLQRAIEQVIQREGLVDTYAMKDSIRVSAVTGDVGNIEITINAIYYYVFQDLGAPRANIRANDITEKALRTNQGQKFIEEVYQEYVSWIDANYPILETSRLVIEGYNLKYNLFGDPTGKYNGSYDPQLRLRV